MNVAEMRTLRWMSGVTIEDRIRNEYIRGSLGVASIVDKRRRNKLRCCGHVMRREESEAVIIVMKTNVIGKRGRGRPKKKWLRVIENDTRTSGVCEIGDRVKLKFKTSLARPQTVEMSAKEEEKK
ncbi:Hypothetical protein CINCED_3A013440 [Cinara cedri]|uniref:Uncharacterized protein n=1 Tax=Cinara cedri TaxID=506608 RepID=A0A5E4MCR7_9HEMI|nr:Hypothetical protein CINCED_3A013440 [Cinara cedri]